jgi:divalent metal cation (Fe/Co/Zn/Cd) transporter
MERGIQMEPHTRQKIITRTAILGIAVNLVIASMKIMVGTITSSLAILSEGMNNAADAATSVLTIASAVVYLKSTAISWWIMPLMTGKD